MAYNLVNLGNGTYGAQDPTTGMARSFSTEDQAKQFLNVPTIDYSKAQAPSFDPSQLLGANADKLMNVSSPAQVSTDPNQNPLNPPQNAPNTTPPTPSVVPNSPPTAQNQPQNGANPVFYKPGPNDAGYTGNPLQVFNSKGEALSHDQYIAQGGNPNYLNVHPGPVPTDNSGSSTPQPTSQPDISNNNGTAAPQTPKIAPEDFSKLYSDAYTSLGLPSVKTQIDNYNQKLLDLNNEKSDQIVTIKNNPWYSESVKSKELSNLDEKYALRLSNLQGFLTLSNNLYQEGLSQAQFITTGQYNQQQDQIAEQDKQIAATQAKQQAIQKIANDNNLKTPYIVDNGTVYRVSDGKGYSDPNSFFKDAGITSFADANSKGLLSTVDGNVTAQHTAVLDVMSKYPDAGILPTDTLVQAQAKLSRSQIYKKDTYIAPNAYSGVTGSIYSPLAGSRFALEATRIAKNFIDLPGYQLTANGLPYIQRIQAAIQTPGSISDQELLDAMTKLSTSGNAVTDAQIKIITGGQNYADKLNVFGNKIASSGGVLSNQQRQDLVKTATDIYSAYSKAYQPIYNQVTNQLKNSGVPESFWTIPNLNTLSTQTNSGGDYQSYLNAIGQ